MKIQTGFDFPFIGSVRRRLGMAGADGLRGNEAKVRTLLWYSSFCMGARAPCPRFCTGGHARQEFRPLRPAIML